MSATRDRVLANIRAARGRGPLDAAAARRLEDRLRQPRSGIIPKRAAGDAEARIGLFVDMAREASATVAELPDMAAVPAAIAEYLRQAQLAPRFAAAPDPILDAIPWGAAPALEIRRGIARDTDVVGFTRAYAGIAETGTLVAASGAESPSTLHLLPETHIALVTRDRIVATYEDVWASLREAGSGHTGSDMPRTVCLITGPSRTGDIEQIIQMGAHGPRRLHILLVKDG